ncbi:MAG: hypothetical protein ABFQ65_04050 [Nanoarchaeota archaeon]
MSKSLCVKIKLNNYYKLQSNLGISKTNSINLIKSTHSIYGFWRGYPRTVEELINESKIRNKKGATALDYIKSNYRQRILESESKIMGPENLNY